jgi:hypothetical protein
VKKTLLVAALAAMLLFAVVGSAFAVNESAQQRIGAKVPVTTGMSYTAPNAPTGARVWVSGGESAVVSGTPVNGAGTNIYEDWNPTLLGNAKSGDAYVSDPTQFAGNSPHGNYTTTTVKCVVCHAVHYAAPGGGPVGSSGAKADTLLRVKASEACAYCHATAGEAVNGRPVYNGVGATTIIADTGTPQDNNTGHYSGSNCNVCHTNVHGAGADTSVASLNGYLLNKFTTTGVNGDPGVTTDDMIGAIDAVNSKAQQQGFTAGAMPNTTGTYAGSNAPGLREEAVGIFCAECHNGSYATGVANASTSVRSESSLLSFSGHRIGAAATSTWNAAGTTSSGSRTIGTIAWAAADNCKSCHDATDDYGNVAFPHAWGLSGINSSKMWLEKAARTGATKTSVGQAVTPDSAALQLQDGVCLKCHVSSDGASGVGITF